MLCILRQVLEKKNDSLRFLRFPLQYHERAELSSSGIKMTTFDTLNSTA